MLLASARVCMSYDSSESGWLLLLLSLMVRLRVGGLAGRQKC